MFQMEGRESKKYHKKQLKETVKNRKMIHAKQLKMAMWKYVQVNI